MDIERAIEQLQSFAEVVEKMLCEEIFREEGNIKMFVSYIDTYKTAISAMQELEQYRKLGASPQRCAELISERSAAKRILAHYETIGTLEECREAVEKQKQKKPIKAEESRIRYTEGYICPRCGGGFSGTGIAGYCYHCGQAIDWSEEENDGEINNS